MGRVAALVLHPQRAHPEFPGELVGAGQPGPAGLGTGYGEDARRHREQVRVTPDARGPGLNARAGQRRELVSDLQRPETLSTGVCGAKRGRGAAFAAEEVTGEAETGRSA